MPDQNSVLVVHIGDGTWAHADDAEVVEIPLDVWAENEESGVAIENYLKNGLGIRRPVVPDSAAAPQVSSTTSTAPPPGWRAPTKIPGVPAGTWGGECAACESEEGACFRSVFTQKYWCSACAAGYAPQYFVFVPTLAT
jgi:hypothetical protein